MCITRCLKKSQCWNIAHKIQTLLLLHCLSFWSLTGHFVLLGLYENKVNFSQRFMNILQNIARLSTWFEMR